MTTATGLSLSEDPRTRRAQLGQNRMTFTRFLLCLLLFPFVSSAQVAPPTNVTLTCRSQKNILYWDHDQIVPGLRFLVKILSDSSLKGCHDEIWVDGPPLQANVSFLSDPDATYFLTVKAVFGNNESVPSPTDGLTFSYFHSSLEGQKCLLDLPPVNVTPEPHHIQFQFKHPWLVYKEGLSGCKEHKNKKSHQRVSESKLPNFEYKVKMAGQEQDHNFECEDAVCEGRLQVDAAQDQHCLKIQGSLKKMSVESTNEYCAPKTEPPHSNTTLYIWIGIVILMGAALVAIMIYWRRTSPSSVTPRPLIFGNEETHPPLMPPDDLVSPVRSVPVSPREEDEQSFIPSVPGFTEYEGRMKLKPEDPEKGNAADDDAAYMEGGNLASDNEEQESDQESRSPYERRSVVLELAPEDRAEGYRG